MNKIREANLYCPPYLPAWYSGDGLVSALNDAAERRVWVTLGAMVTIPSASCNENNQYLGVQLLRGDGTADSWTDNDYIAVKLPPMRCTTSGNTIGTLR